MVTDFIRLSTDPRFLKVLREFALRYAAHNQRDLDFAIEKTAEVKKELEIRQGWWIFVEKKEFFDT